MHFRLLRGRQLIKIEQRNILKESFHFFCLLLYDLLIVLSIKIWDLCDFCKSIFRF